MPCQMCGIPAVILFQTPTYRFFILILRNYQKGFFNNHHNIACNWDSSLSTLIYDDNKYVIGSGKTAQFTRSLISAFYIPADRADNSLQMVYLAFTYLVPDPSYERLKTRIRKQRLRENALQKLMMNLTVGEN